MKTFTLVLLSILLEGCVVAPRYYPERAFRGMERHQHLHRHNHW